MYYSFIFFLHISYGKYSNAEVSEPATYAKRLEFSYLCFGISNVIYAMDFPIGKTLFGLTFIFTLSYSLLLMRFDKPIDKKKRIIVNENGDREPYVISNDGHYFVYTMFILSMAGAMLAESITFAALGGPLIQSVSLQFFSIFVLFGIQVSTQGATDRQRFAPLMLIVYFQVDFFQTSLFLNSNFGTKEFWLMIIVGECSSIIKNCGFNFLACSTNL